MLLHMRKKRIGAGAALALAAPVGLAKSHTAALKQVRAGCHIPGYGSRARKVYRANDKTMDRDRDGTACER